MKFLVTFTRVYEIEQKDIEESLFEANYDESEITEEVLEWEAENTAYRYLEEDMFNIDARDFASLKMEKITD